MDISTVLSEAWGLYRRFLWQFFLTAVTVFVVLDLLSALAELAAGDSLAAGIFWSVVAAVIGVAGFFWVQAALVELVRDVRDGRADRTVGGTYRAVQPRLPALIVAGLLAAFGIGLGFLLLIVPGLFLLVIWSMLIPTISAGTTIAVRFMPIPPSAERHRDRCPEASVLARREQNAYVDTHASICS